MALVETGAVEYGRKVELWGDRSGSRKIQKEEKKPVIIYEVSPKIIHVEASGFMALVQQLTGHASSSSAATNGADEGNPRGFPVKVKARLLKRNGTEEELLSILPSSCSHDSETRKCGCFQEGDSMVSENWFKWGGRL